MTAPEIPAAAPKPPPSAPGPTHAAFSRVVTMAVRLFDVPGAVVLTRDYEGNWRVSASQGDNSGQLTTELLRHTRLLDTREEFVLVPDLDDDARFPSAIPLAGAAPVADAWRLRFLAAATYRDVPGTPRPAGCLCLLDARPRQLRTEDRRLLGELAAILGDEAGLLAPVGLLAPLKPLAPLAAELAPSRTPGPQVAHRTADLTAVSLGPVTRKPDNPHDAELEARVEELIRLNDSLRSQLTGSGGEDGLSRVRLEQLIEESGDLIGLATLDGKTYYLNTAGQRIVGLDGPEDIKKTRVIDCLMREDKSFFLGTVVPNLMRTGHWEGDFRFRHFKTGQAIPVSWNLFLIRDPSTGEPAGMATVARDITERQRAENALRESERRFRHLVEQAAEAIFVYDLSGRLIDVNEESCRMLGYPRAELLMLTAEDIDPEPDPEKRRERWKSMVPGVAVTLDGTLRRRDKSLMPIEARVAAFRSEGQKLVLALVRDVTERRLAEKELREAHEQLEARVRDRTAELAQANEGLQQALRENSLLATAIESSQIGVLISDPGVPDIPTIFANPAFTRITGYERQDVVGRNCRFLQGPDTDPAEVEEIRQAVLARRPYKGTLRNYRKDGTPFWNELTINPVFDEAGRLINFVGLQSDVTAQAEVLEALKRSELRFARMTANVPGMVFQLLLHEDGTAEFPYVSEGCRELFGQEPAQMRPDACTLLDLIHEEDIGEFLASLNRSKESGEAWAWEGRYHAAEGEIRYLQGAARPERRTDGDTLWDGLLLDITTRKRAEHEIAARARQSAAVAELGQRALASTDYLQLAEAAAELVTRTLGIELCAVSEMLAGSNELVVRAGAGFERPIAGLVVPAGTGSMGGFTILKDTPLIIEDLEKETRCQLKVPWLENGAASSLSVVIRGREQPVGSLCIAARHARAFSSEDTNFLQAVANVLATAMDRSRDEQALRKSEARNAAILETALDGIITVDHMGRIVEFNPAAEKTFGFARAEVLEMPFHALVPAAQDISSPKLRERTEQSARHANGSRPTVEMAVTRIPVEGLPLFTAHLRDIGARKLTEAALHQAKEEAERANAAKSEFLSRMSHELRTPLNAILGFGQLLQMQQLPPAQNDRIGHIVTAGRHLLSLINEVLDIARIEAGRVELSLEPVRLSEALGEALDLIRPLAAQANVKLHTMGEDHPLHGEHVMADRQRFKQVLLNLLSNAVKYNREGGDVRLKCVGQDGDRLRVCIEDTGQGIPPENMSRLFVAFDRLGAENSTVQGTGLGLALTKRLIEAMGGTVGVQSTPGQGTTFWIELPRTASMLEVHTRQRREKGGAPQAMEKLSTIHTVLYIEDNLSNLALITHLLDEHPEIRLITAMRGWEGVEKAREHQPELILLDLHLPDIPGWDVLAELQKDERTSGIPVIAVSADATPRQIERLMKAGARAYLTKPLEVDRFQKMLRQVLEPELV